MVFWFHTYIQQILTHEKLEKLTKILQNILILKIFTNGKQRIVSALVFLIMEIRKNIQFICQKIFPKDMLIYC